ncbi:MAG: globin domain-containing protein [Pseudomonadota bacterium]
MALSAEQIATIRATWAKTAPVAAMASRLFYGRLFRLAPHTRGLFPGDLEAQGRKLTATLGFVVDHLDQPETLAPAARALAVRHIDYGVTADQYAPVGEALIWTFKELLGPAFGEKENAAWLAAYAALSTMMIDAAYSDAPGDAAV